MGDFMSESESGVASAEETKPAGRKGAGTNTKGGRAKSGKKDDKVETPSVREGKSPGPPKGTTTPPFPRSTIETALVLPEAIQEHAAGQRIRRLTLFEKMEKSPESSGSRMMITNSNRYGLTTGSYAAEFIELTALGQRASSPETTAADRRRAQFEAGILGIEPFNALYEAYKGKRLPSPEVMRDALAEVGVAEAHRKECVDLFLENAKYLALLRTVAGAQRLAPIEQVLESSPLMDPADTPNQEAQPRVARRLERQRRSYKNVCFVIAPIGEEGTEPRKHSDMVLESLLERALEGQDLEVVRADKITDPGMISGQVIEHLLHARLVVADLSFHNPNVFYELAIRHMTGLPTVHLIRRSDTVPFDLKDFRTIHIDTSDKYELVAKLDTYRAEIANHVRMALSAGSEGSNPVTAFAKGLTVGITGTRGA
jgi:hypothetical protein